MIKYEFEQNDFPEYNFKDEFNIEKDDQGEIELSFEGFSLKDVQNSKLEITYSVYLYNQTDDIENIFANILKNDDNNNNPFKKLNPEFQTEGNKNKIKFNSENSNYIVLATVKYNGNEEKIIYKVNNNKEEEEPKRVNDLIFYIIMGSFAFIIIFVFILIFCIINKRKANNPDIDDEQYNNIPVLRETINEDES